MEEREREREKERESEREKERKKERKRERKRERERETDRILWACVFRWIARPPSLLPWTFSTDESLVGAPKKNRSRPLPWLCGAGRENWNERQRRQTLELESRSKCKHTAFIEGLS